MGWSDLPSDLAISIAARLWEAGDYLRFRAVCRSWKSAVGGFRPSFFPWLAAIPCNRDHLPNENELSFFSHVTNDRVYESKCPTPRSGIESSHISTNKDGWMMFVPEADGVAIIFNPVTGAQLQHLPSLYTCFGGIDDVFLSDNLFAFAIVGNTDDGHGTLVAAAPGDDTWSVILSSLPYHYNTITDIVFHEADHKFYAVHRNGNLLAFCLTRCGGGKTVVGQVSTLSRSKGREDYRLFGGARLVSCGSNLLQVRQRKEENFEILKYCPDADTWIGVTDIGDNSLFLDSYGAKLLPLPQGEEGRLRRNCIYKLHYRYEGYTVHAIYEVSKGIVEEPFFSMDIKSHFHFHPALMWFMPFLSINT